ncbi:uncharacterized protein F5147DRAFT_75888 [Suillus discolor]|uniref:Uncharacterized protein n=1 Tax=Suillus discolor TaxID=1912936 RepID=A0A9P7ESG5_9AGAM|nr:uncharacterized protein F5147DRAFT_75888 [Suillus discolor]KAG2086665.1 hypothetical protein F5147DRAFT_75888 [Suillus discolor]
MYKRFPQIFSVNHHSYTSLTMQLSVLLSALISFVILATASPTPGAISKRSFERNTLDTYFRGDLLVGSKKRKELATHLAYSDDDVPSTGGKECDELESRIAYDN